MILKDKIVVVTGAAQGIGKSIAQVLVDKGAYVIVADINEEKGKQTEKELGNAEFYKIDLTNDDEVESLFEYVHNQYGRIDSLVNDAGIQIREWATDFDLEKFDAVIKLNLRSYYVCSRVAARYMKEQHKGTIVCISSVNGTRYHSKRSAYNISKAGVNGMCGTLAVELGRFGIRVNSVAPGFIYTGMTAASFDIPDVRAKSETLIPNGRLGMPKDIASVVLFLLSDMSDYVTGTMLFADGGYHIQK